MEYKNTECKNCKTKQSLLFARPNMRDNKDFFCKPCMDGGEHLK